MRKWVEAMRCTVRGASTGKTFHLFEPRSVDRLCSAHFEDSMFQRNFEAEFVAAGLLTADKKIPKTLIVEAVSSLFQHNRLTRISDGRVERQSLYLKRKYSQLDDEESEEVMRLVHSRASVAYLRACVHFSAIVQSGIFQTYKLM